MPMMPLFKNRVAACSLALSLTAGILWLAVSLKYQEDNPLTSQVIGDASLNSRILRGYILDDGHPIPDLFPLEPLDYVGFACTILGLVLSAGAGIGGGGLLVPIFILIFDFCVKHAIPLASATVLGGALANNLLNVRKSHPDHPSRPAIDFDLLLMLEPMTVAGALIGADLNDLLPDVVLVVMLFLLLSLTAYKTLQKANKLYQKENDEKLLAAQDTESLLVSAKAYVEENGYANTDHSSYGSVEDSNVDDSNKAPLNTQPSFGNAQMHQAWVAAAQLTALFVVITIMNLLKGGAGESGGGPMGLAVCGPTCFWVMEAAMLFVILVFSVFVRRSILERANSEGGAVLSEIEWDEDNTITYPLYAIVAGLVAGLFGVGGGIVKGPLMLALGVHPAVASATSACMILFTSSTSTISYAIFDLLIYDYAAGCIVIGFVSTLFGQTLMHMLMEKYKRNSYIAYTIGIVVGLSAIAMTIEASWVIFF